MSEQPHWNYYFVLLFANVGFCCQMFKLRDMKICFFWAKKCFFCVCFEPVTLQMLYKLKTSKVFEKPKVGEGRAAELVEEDPFAVQMVSWCPQSRIFCVVGISAHIILYRFSKYEANNQIVVSEEEINQNVCGCDVVDSELPRNVPSLSATHTKDDCVAIR